MKKRSALEEKRLQRFSKEWKEELKQFQGLEIPDAGWQRLVDRATASGKSRFYGGDGDASLFEKAAVQTFQELFRTAENEMPKKREQLLDRVANGSLDSQYVQTTMNRFGFTQEETAALPSYKLILQSIWSRDVPILKKQGIVDFLLIGATKRSDLVGVVAPLPWGRLDFPPNNFPGQFALAILENWQDMATCANPNCAAPYFLASRSTQVVCERGDCLRYRLRKKARDHWRKKSAEETKRTGTSRKGEK
jgi:hypothetical protein